MKNGGVRRFFRRKAAGKTGFEKAPAGKSSASASGPTSSSSTLAKAWS